MSSHTFCPLLVISHINLQYIFMSGCVQGLLALEGELTPILVQMVKSANMNGLLDSDSDSLTDCQQRVKARLHEIMQKNKDFSEEDYNKVKKVPTAYLKIAHYLRLTKLALNVSCLFKLAPTGSPSLVNSMRVIVNPVKTCDQVHTLIKSLTCQICKRLEDPKSAGWSSLSSYKKS